MAKVVLLLLASLCTNCWGARVHTNASAGHLSLTNSSHFSLWENVITDRIKHELEFKAEPPKVNKLVWALLALCFGVCGCDRCFMGQICLGVIKGLTLGGCLVWQFIDYWVCAINSYEQKKDIKTVGYDASFEAESISAAYYFTIVIVVMHILQFVNQLRMAKMQYDMQREMFKSLQEASAAEPAPILKRHQSLAYLPTRLTSGLRGAGLITEKPTIPELLALFNKLDTNGDGQLDREELTAGLKELGTSDEDVDEMLKDADTDKDGKISKDEWLVHLTQKAANNSPRP